MVADSFYKYLVDKGALTGKPIIDSSNESYALHRAVQSIREEVDDIEQGLLMWARMYTLVFDMGSKGEKVTSRVF